MGLIVTGAGLLLLFRRPQHQLQHPPGGIVHRAFRQRTGLHGFLHLFFHVAAAAGHTQVTPCPEPFDSVVHGAPVGDHHALKAPFPAQNAGEQLFMVAAMGTVEFGIGTHHRGRLSLPDGDLESGEIQLPQGALVQDTVRGEAAKLLGVGREVLETGSHAPALHPADKARRQFACQKRVLAEILKVSPAQGVAFQIRPGAQYQPHPLFSRFFANGRTDALQQIGVPAGGGGHFGRKAGGRAGHIHPHHIRGVFLFAQTVGPVAHKQRGNAVFFVCLGFPKVLAGTEGDLFFQRHPAQNLFNPVHCSPPIGWGQHSRAAFPPSLDPDSLLPSSSPFSPRG